MGHKAENYNEVFPPTTIESTEWGEFIRSTLYCQGKKAYTKPYMAYSIYPFKLFSKKKTVLTTFFLAIALNAFVWAWIAVGTTQRGEAAVLHYNILFQIDRLGSFGALYMIPGLGLAIIAINFLGAWLLYGYDTVLAKLISVSTVVLQVLLLTAVSVLVFLNA